MMHRMCQTYSARFPIYMRDSLLAARPSCHQWYRQHVHGSIRCQVALLFLSRGAMPLEPAWRQFLEAAALVEPVALQQYTAMYAACLRHALTWLTSIATPQLIAATKFCSVHFTCVAATATALQALSVAGC